ncbi:NAD(P)H-hydrate epimerase [Miniimonas sp. S16]|uniref:NAD(P)H-hydrate epimerase n=1 Tax=Miniimonas sp. S16 TaxID=2171623 RepID=UPI001900C58B|nr:NAD(P)H-hydrate epimerase [Miniimonas sp. S16]
MLRAYPAADVRAAEEPLLAAGAPLMATAARAVELAVVHALRERTGGVAGGRVVVLVGAGNNGGDGLYAAAGLARRGVGVHVLTTSEHPHAGGLAALRGGTARLVPLAQAWPAQALRAVADAVGPADVVVDAVAGTGVTGGLRGVAATVVAATREAVEAAPRPPVVVAVDVPSGIGVDDGALPGDVLPADVTVTMGVAKPGLLLPPATVCAGRVEVVDLGLDLTRRTPAAARLTDADVADLWPVPHREDHKYSRGVLGVVAGSDRYPGAAVLATSAAAPLAGMVRYVGPDGAARHVLDARPEVVVGSGRVQAWVVGPGVGDDDTARLRDVRRALAEGLGTVPVVVDAGALLALPERVAPTAVLTPHAGELARLLSAWGRSTSRADVEADPVGAARRAVSFTGATVLLKGATTLVVGPSEEGVAGSSDGTGTVYAQADGTDWLATAGAGDVLAGVLGALLAGRSADVMAHPPLAARLAAAAALVHGRAARAASAGGPLVALDVARAVPGVVATLLAPPLRTGPGGRMPG